MKDGVARTLLNNARYVDFSRVHLPWRVVRRRFYYSIATVCKWRNGETLFSHTIPHSMTQYSVILSFRQIQQKSVSSFGHLQVVFYIYLTKFSSADTAAKLRHTIAQIKIVRTRNNDQFHINTFSTRFQLQFGHSSHVSGMKKESESLGIWTYSDT